MRVADSRVDILIDNMAVIQSFENQGGKCRSLNNKMKQIFAFLCSYNIDLHLRYVPTNLNEADFPSRQLSLADSTLAGPSWMLVERHFGPHKVDLMALDSNAMKSSDGMSLRHFTPGPSPLSPGVNIFSQNISCETNPYVFPPISMIFPLVSFLKEQHVRGCTLVAPVLQSFPIWWPILQSYCIRSVLIGRLGEKGVIKVPSKRGFVLDNEGLKWDLEAYRLYLARDYVFLFGCDFRFLQLVIFAWILLRLTTDCEILNRLYVQPHTAESVLVWKRHLNCF